MKEENMNNAIQPRAAGEDAHTPHLDTTGLPLVHGPHEGFYLVTQGQTPFSNFALVTTKEDAQKVVHWGNSHARLTAENKALREALEKLTLCARKLVAASEEGERSAIYRATNVLAIAEVQARAALASTNQ